MHSPVPIGKRSQSWKVLSLNYHVSMSVAFFVAIFVCSLTCEPRAVYLRPGGRGGVRGWIHTLLNVIHNIKELRVSVKDVLQGLKSVKALCNSHELLRILIKSTPNHLKTWNRLPSKLYLRLPPESFPNSQQVWVRKQRQTTNTRLKSWNNRASCQEKRRMTRGFRRHSQQQNLNRVLLEALKGLWVVISIPKPKFQVPFVAKTWRNKTNDNVGVCGSLR